MALDIGSRLGHYDVTALIGEGGMRLINQARALHRSHDGAVHIASRENGQEA